jgi:hypothetical protein
MHSPVGTAGYAAPEVLILTDGEHAHSCTYLADVYSVGVLIYELVTVFRPDADGAAQAWRRATEKPALAFVVSAMLKHDPMHRAKKPWLPKQLEDWGSQVVVVRGLEECWAELAKLEADFAAEEKVMPFVCKTDEEVLRIVKVGYDVFPANVVVAIQAETLPTAMEPNKLDRELRDLDLKTDTRVFCGDKGVSHAGRRAAPEGPTAGRIGDFVRWAIHG